MQGKTYEGSNPSLSAIVIETVQFLDDRIYNMNGSGGVDSVAVKHFELGKWKFYYDINGKVEKTTHICKETIFMKDINNGEGHVRPFRFFKWAIRCDNCFARMPYKYKRKAEFTAVMKAKMG